VCRNFTVVGLPTRRLARARAGSGCDPPIGLGLPPQRITVNLSPADRAKEGTHYDLPIATRVAGSHGRAPGAEHSGFVALGELALDGRLSRVTGVLPAAIAAPAKVAVLSARSLRRRGAWGGFEMGAYDGGSCADRRGAARC